MHLEREGGADDLLLVLRGHVAVLHPAFPIRAGVEEQALAQGAEVLVDALAIADDHVATLGDSERSTIEVAQRHIGREKQGVVAAFVHEVVAAQRGLQRLLRPAIDRLTFNADPRRARQRIDDPHQPRRPHVASVFHPARREIDNAKRAFVAVKDRFDDVGIRQIALLAAPTTRRRNREVPALRIEQSTKDRLAVKARQTRPDDAAEPVHEGRTLAVADQSEVFEALLRHGARCARAAPISDRRAVHPGATPG